MIKRLTFVRRHQSLSEADFATRWREAAQATLDTAPVTPSRVAHCVARHAASQCHGVSLEWFEDPDATDAYDRWCSSYPHRPVIEPESPLRVLVEERTVDGEDWLGRWWDRRTPSPSTPVLIGCIEPANGLSRTQFRDYWWGKHRPLANRLVPTQLAPLAYVHNYVLPGQPGTWAGVGEIYERSLGTARDRGAWFETEAAQALVEDEERFLVRSKRVVLVTDQEVIKAH